MWVKKKVKRYRWVYIEEEIDCSNIVNPGNNPIRTIKRHRCVPHKVWAEVWVGPEKYQKKSNHKKKQLSEKELNKKAWREKKKLKKERSKPGCKQTGMPKWLKRHCNKSHRNYEKRCIQREEYGKLKSKGIPKNLFDPWDWY